MLDPNQGLEADSALCICDLSNAQMCGTSLYGVTVGVTSRLRQQNLPETALASVPGPQVSSNVGISETAPA